MTNSLKGKDPEAEMTFAFEGNELTLEIEEEATPGWIIEPAMTPYVGHHFHNLKLCVMLQITKELVDSCDPGEGPVLCKVRIAFEQQSSPPRISLRNNHST